MLTLKPPKLSKWPGAYFTGPRKIAEPEPISPDRLAAFETKFQALQDWHNSLKEGMNKNG
jgi:hypothetical protein